MAEHFFAVARDDAEGIQRLGGGAERLVNARVGMVAAALVAEGPRRNGRVVAVAGHHAAQRLQAGGAQVARLVPHDGARGVEQVVDGAAVVVVRHAPRIAAHAAALLRAQQPHAVGHGHADCGEVIVVAEAAQLDVLTVEVEAVGDLPVDGAHADGRVHGVEHGTAGGVLDGGGHGVERGALDGPELGGRQRDGRSEVGGAARRHSLRRGHAAPHGDTRRRIVHVEHRHHAAGARYSNGGGGQGVRIGAHHSD